VPRHNFVEFWSHKIAAIKDQYELKKTTNTQNGEWPKTVYDASEYSAYKRRQNCFHQFPAVSCFARLYCASVYFAQTAAA